MIVVGRIGYTMLALVSAPIVARALHPEGRGETAAAIAAFYIVPILLCLGLPLEVRRLAALGNGYDANRTARMLALAMLPVSAAIGWILSTTVFGGLDGNARTAVWVGIAIAPFTIWWMCDLSILIAERRFVATALLELMLQLVFVPTILAGWLTGVCTVAFVLWANIAGTVATTVLGALLSRTRLLGSLSAMGRTIRSSLTFAGSAAAEAASNRLDLVVALPLLGAFQTGLYSAAVTLSTLPMAIAYALGASFFTDFAESEPAVVQRAQQAGARVSLAVGFAASTAVAIASPVAVYVLFGSKFYGAIGPAVVLLFGTSMMISSQVLNMGLVATSRGISMTVVQLIGLTVGVCLLLALGGPFGAWGAAAAASSSALTVWILLIRRIGGCWREYVPAPRDLTTGIKRLLKRVDQPDS
ncbi:hypothetical protein CH253_29695 [Rhodococcus sp. 06-156-3C]|nr:hypothetical protein CH280_21265 [Rhodococcus sp. 06-156-4C]OZD11551.1 hypothetical protein CH253_29695 [Rhodococcus sp. 06-156-3C]OZD13787.1 hypothetical protein CH248_27200 [Rhodococcus sp. 06-156-4a]OZD28067.1 hypothetical protein CH247_19960 [Rhodococcus sp. 06-156-3b]OZD30412.1 hypothetical protein CH284_25780 [Rhodococcus sp. 06-156-3]OZF71100.1 hypothetical protein CH290_02155 [Rhodococcus sp. 06-156-4]